MYNRRGTTSCLGCVIELAVALLIMLIFLAPLFYFELLPWQKKKEPDKFFCGSGANCYLTGVKDYQAGNYEDAARLLHTGCKWNYPASCVLRGRMSLDGKTATASPVEAQYYFRMGCQKGDATSCHLLADTYYRYFRNRPEGLDMVQWAWPRSCDLGSPEGCLGYAWFLTENAKSKQEINAALALLDKTCSLAGQGEICQRAGEMRERILRITPGKTDSGKKPPEQQAAPAELPANIKNLEDACSQEDTPACLSLGAYYEHDEGLLPDKRREKAMEVYGKLCQKRDPRGCQEFRRLKNAWGR